MRPISIENQQYNAWLRSTLFLNKPTTIEEYMRSTDMSEQQTFKLSTDTFINFKFKKGDWKCGYDKWHTKREECGHMLQSGQYLS